MSSTTTPRLSRSARLAVVATLDDRDTYSRRAIAALMLEQSQDDASTVVQPQVFDDCIYVDGTPAAPRHDASGVCEDDVEWTSAPSMEAFATSADGSPLECDTFNRTRAY